MDINQKGTITLQPGVRIVKKSDKAFELITDNRTFLLFSDLAGQVDKWIEDINKVLDSL